MKYVPAKSTEKGTLKIKGLNAILVP